MIWVEGTNFYKIGRTKNIKKRLNAMKTGNPFNLHVIFRFEMSGQLAVDVERELHYSYKDSKIRGEWFALSSTQRGKLEKKVARITEECAAIIKSNLFNKD